MVGVLCACFTLGSALTSAQQPSEHEKHHPGGEAGQQDASPAPDASGGKSMMGPMCAMMQKDMEKMHAEMSENHAKLERQVKGMNAATGSAKVDAVAAVVTEMVAQSGKMHSMHEAMMDKMMQHMSEHMMQGMGAPQKSEMMTCPMMKGHGDAPSEHDGHGDEKQAPAPSVPEESGSKGSGHHSSQANP